MSPRQSTTPAAHAAAFATRAAVRTGGHRTRRDRLGLYRDRPLDRGAAPALAATEPEAKTDGEPRFHRHCRAPAFANLSPATGAGPRETSDRGLSTLLLRKSRSWAWCQHERLAGTSRMTREDGRLKMNATATPQSGTKDENYDLIPATHLCLEHVWRLDQSRRTPSATAITTLPACSGACRSTAAKARRSARSCSASALTETNSRHPPAAADHRIALVEQSGCKHPQVTASHQTARAARILASRRPQLRPLADDPSTVRVRQRASPKCLQMR